MTDDHKPLIVSPGIDAVAVHNMQNSPRARIANEFYRTATGIKNRAGAFVGFALTDQELEKIIRHEAVRGRELAKAFFKQFSQDTGASEVGRFILVGTEVDMFLDLLAGVPVADGYRKIREIVSSPRTMKADEINRKEEGRRW